MLHAVSGKVANVALYDDWGHANRVPVVALTKPVPIAISTNMVADVTLPPGGSNQSLTGRVLYNFVDMPSRKRVCVNGGSCLSVTQTGRVWSAGSASTATMSRPAWSGHSPRAFP